MSESTAIQFMYLINFFSRSRFLSDFLLPSKLVKHEEGSIKMNQEGSSNEKWCPVDKWTTTLGTDYNVPASQTQGTKQCIVNVMFYMSKLKVKVTRGG